MLCLVVRSIAPDQVFDSHCYPDNDWRFCYRRTLALIRRLNNDPEYPRHGQACVGVLHIPDNLPELVEKRKFKCAEVVFHAMRFDTRTEIPVAPEYVKAQLGTHMCKTSPMKVDVRYSCLEALPPELRSIVPDKRIDPEAELLELANVPG